MPFLASPYLAISRAPTGSIYAEIVYVRTLIENRLWLHILIDECLDTGLYQATYITNEDSTRGIYSVFAHDKVGDKWLIKGLFESLQTSEVARAMSHRVHKTARTLAEQLLTRSGQAHSP
jgi:hypothetical protein